MQPLRQAACPNKTYVEALLADLERDLPNVRQRRIETVFIGGGTPSLFSPEAIHSLLKGIAARIPLAPDVEITLEANPAQRKAESFAVSVQPG